MGSLRRWRQIGQGLFHRWETAGEELEGTWQGQHDGPYGPLGSLDTTTGRITFPLHVALRERLTRVREGAEVLIRYTGKQTSKAGRVFKGFDAFVAEAVALLAEPAGGEFPAQLLLPPPVVLGRVAVDGLVVAPVNRGVDDAVPGHLVVAQFDSPLDRLLEDPGLARLAVDQDQPRPGDVDRDDRGSGRARGIAGLERLAQSQSRRLKYVSMPTRIATMTPMTR